MINSERRDTVTILRMEHRRANALDIELCAGLRDAFADVAKSSARAVVLTGTGGIFSAGADLFRVLDGGPEYVSEFLPALTRALQELFTFSLPVVAAINGHAIAGGCILACACDYRLMSQGPGTIGVPELAVGVPFPITALEILRSATPPQHLQRLAYGGQTVSADAGLGLGLVDEVVRADELIARACDLAERIGAIPSHSFRTAKHMVRAPALQRIAEGASASDPQVLAIWQDPETHAVIRAYLARTIPAKRR